MKFDYEVRAALVESLELDAESIQLRIQMVNSDILYGQYLTLVVLSGRIHLYLKRWYTLWFDSMPIQLVPWILSQPNLHLTSGGYTYHN